MSVPPENRDEGLDSAMADSLQASRKRRVVVSVIRACDLCRASKVRCDGAHPCERCSRRSTPCVFSQAKKRGPHGSKNGKKEESSEVWENGHHAEQDDFGGEEYMEEIVRTPVKPTVAADRLVLPLALAREVAIASTPDLTLFIREHTQRLSLFWNEPEDYFLQKYRTDTPQGSLQLYSMLSLAFRGSRNIPAAQTYLQRATIVAKDVFDDYGTSSSFESGMALSLLSFAYLPSDAKKAKFYSKVALNLLEDVKPTDFKSTLMRRLTITSVSSRTATVPIRLDDLVEDMEKIDRGCLPPAQEISDQSLSPFYNFLRASRISHITSHPMYRLMRRRVPESVVDDEVIRDPQLAARLFVIQGFLFVRNVIVSFQPHLIGTLESLVPNHAIIHEGGIPQRFSSYLLEFIEMLDKITAIVHSPNDKMRVPPGDDLRTLIYRSMGMREEALHYARETKVNCMKWIHDFGITVLFKIVLPLFLCGACFLQYDCYDELDEVLRIFEQYTDRYIFISQAVEVLSGLKAQALASPRSSSSSETQTPELLEEQFTSSHDSEEEVAQLQQGGGGSSSPYNFHPHQSWHHSEDKLQPFGEYATSSPGQEFVQFGQGDYVPNQDSAYQNQFLANFEGPGISIFSLPDPFLNQQSVPTASPPAMSPFTKSFSDR